MTYQIELPVFEGLFDLLLFFIQRDELDIYDIPIAKVTGNFLKYIEGMEQTDIEIASDFILVAATLMRIKAKMLLPRQELDAEGNLIDPRKELVQQLLEYKKFKAVAQEMIAWEENMLKRNPRGNVVGELREIARKIGVEVQLEEVDLYQIMTAYQEMNKRHLDEVEKLKLKSIMPYPYTVAGQKKYILYWLTHQKRISFVEILAECPTRVYASFNFLAILDMLQSNLIGIDIGDGFNNFWIFRVSSTKNAVFK